MKIRKGDTIKVLYGKDAGKKASVLSVNIKEKTVIADGVNVYKKHIKGDGRDRTSEIVNIVKPLPISKVMLVCPVCGKATRVKMKIEDGKKVRVCTKCGKVMDTPKVKEEAKEAKKTKKTETKKKNNSKKVSKK